MSSLSSPPQSQRLTALLWPHQRFVHEMLLAQDDSSRNTHIPGGMEEAVICAGLSGWRREDALPDGCFLRNQLTAAGSTGSRVSRQQGAAACWPSRPSCCPSNPATSGKSIRGIGTSREGLRMAGRAPWLSQSPHPGALGDEENTTRLGRGSASVRGAWGVATSRGKQQGLRMHPLL